MYFFLNFQTILNDWNSGKIKYYTHPPQTETKETHVNAQIVETFAKEFNLDNLDKMDQDELVDIPEPNPSETMAIESSGMVTNINQDDDDEEEMSDDEDMNENNENIGQLSKNLAFNAKAKAKINHDNIDLPKFKAEGLTKMKKAAKMREKKEKKDRRRRDKVATELSNDLENALGALGKTEKYDFGQDFDM